MADSYFDDENLNPTEPEAPITESTTIVNLGGLYIEAGLTDNLIVYPYTNLSDASRLHPIISANEHLGHTIIYVPLERINRATTIEDDAYYYMPALMNAIITDKWGSIFARDYYSTSMSKEDKEELSAYLRFASFARDVWALDRLYGFDNSMWNEYIESIPTLLDGLSYKNSHTNMESQDFDWAVYMQMCVYAASLSRFTTSLEIVSEIFYTLNKFDDPRAHNQFVFYYNQLIRVLPLKEEESSKENRFILETTFNRILKATGYKKKIKLTREIQMEFPENHSTNYAWTLV